MQVFHRSTNTFARLSIFGALFVLAAAAWGLAEINRSPWVTQAQVARAQPVPFSHKHHAGELGIDCRYCHAYVESSSYAGVPPTQTCMSCHAQIWVDSPMLEPVRASFRSGESIRWTKVYDLPDYVYFNHSIHLAKGIGCVSCHGRIDEMNLTYQEPTLHMEWCLDCHRHPENFVRPKSELFQMSWRAEDQAALGPRLVDEYRIVKRTDCSVCHR